MDFDVLQILEIIKKPKGNLGFSMVFINLAILMQNRQNAATGCPRTFKWRPGASKTIPQVNKTSLGKSKMGLKSLKMGPRSVPMAAQMSHGSPTCYSKRSRKRI